MVLNCYQPDYNLQLEVCHCDPSPLQSEPTTYSREDSDTSATLGAAAIAKESDGFILVNIGEIVSSLFLLSMC